MTRSSASVLTASMDQRQPLRQQVQAEESPVQQDARLSLLLTATKLRHPLECCHSAPAQSSQLLVQRVVLIRPQQLRA
jgi:hypothetical protein